jgi:methyltransferase family protein
MSCTALVIYRAVYVAAKLGIPDLLQNGQLSSDEIAHATGTHPRALYRLLRALSSAGMRKHPTHFVGCLYFQKEVDLSSLGEYIDSHANQNIDYPSRESFGSH